jgi:hypothetical protein
MIRLAAYQDWLHTATKDVAKFWRRVRERHQPLELSSRPVDTLKYGGKHLVTN